MITRLIRCVPLMMSYVDPRTAIETQLPGTLVTLALMITFELSMVNVMWEVMHPKVCDSSNKRQAPGTDCSST